MAFPRLLAMSEVQWTQPEHKDFESFARRLDKEFERLDYCGVNACRNFYEVNQAGAWNKSQQTYEVTLNTFCPDADIYYAVMIQRSTLHLPFMRLRYRWTRMQLFIRQFTEAVSR